MSADWPKLVAKDRAKAYGVPWSEEEAVALGACPNMGARHTLAEKMRAGTWKGETANVQEADDTDAEDSEETDADAADESEEDSDEKGSDEGKETALSKLSKAELKELCDEKKIEYKVSATKQELVDLLSA